MTRDRWHISASPDRYVLARRTPAQDAPLRWDVQAQASFPDVRRGRLAQQVRQDIWRAMRSVRGFSPMIVIERSGDGVTLTAGGQVAGKIPPNMADRLGEMLADADLRARWLRGARKEVANAR